MNQAVQVAMERVNDSEYRASDGSLSMKREFGETPCGNPMSGRWVIRDHRGAMVDFDQYANDLAERHHLKLF